MMTKVAKKQLDLQVPLMLFQIIDSGLFEKKPKAN
jgi:hypothetical protein